MIRINKPTQPSILYIAGPHRGNCKLLIATRNIINDYNNGNALNISVIYKDPIIKRALKTSHHEKCCFCESKITHNYHGDVEHFRPKMEIKQAKSGTGITPGYYWLAYEWNNLFFACKICNTTHKHVLFPLYNPHQRALNHTLNTSIERAIFIHPSDENPEHFIRFYKQYALNSPVPNNHPKRGDSNIKLLGLNRDELLERRKELLDNVILLYRSLKSGGLSPQLESDIIQNFVNLTSDTAQFSSMVRAALTHMSIHM